MARRADLPDAQLCRPAHAWLFSEPRLPADGASEPDFSDLKEEPRQVDELREASKLDEEEFDKALEKLEIHGGARVDFGGGVTRGVPGWKKTYIIQSQFRMEQFEKVLRYTESSGCRMAALVRHFGDVEDASRPCGICDVCDPAGAVLRLFRTRHGRGARVVQAIVDELRAVDYKAQERCNGAWTRGQDEPRRIRRAARRDGRGRG